MRQFSAIYLCTVGLFSFTAVSGCGAPGDGGGCGGGRSRSLFHSSNVTEMAAGSRNIILPMPQIQATAFTFSERSGKAKKFNATTGFGAFPIVYRAIAEESDPVSDFAPAPGEIVAIGSGGTPCGPESDWDINLKIFEGRATVGKRLQAGHTYTIIADDSISSDFSKVRIYRMKGAGEFVATVGSIIVDSVDEKEVTLRLVDLVFQHVDANGKPDAGGCSNWTAPYP